MIDFHHVKPEHRAIDERLHNWRRWCVPSFGCATSAMFRLTPPGKGGEASPVSDSIDEKDAKAIQAAVAVLATPHRKTLAWAYLKPKNPRSAAIEIGVSMEVLLQLLHAARQKLVDSKV